MSKFLKVVKLTHNTKYFHKLCNAIDDLNDVEYHNLMGPNTLLTPFYSTGEIFNKKIKYRMVMLISDLQFAKIKRNTIVTTLHSINFKRENSWNKYVTIAFMEEMMRYKFKRHIPDGIDPEDYLYKISEMYSVPKMKIKSTMSILITNIKRGYDKFNLLDYFDWFELFQYRYKDNEDKLIQDFKANKLNEKEEEIYKQLYNI